MKKKKLIALLTALVLAVTMIAGCGSGSSSDETESADSTQETAEASADTEDASTSDSGVTATELNIAIQPSAAFLPLFIAKENGWIEEALEEYGVTVNWNSFESGPPINESLAAGSSDLGLLGDVPTVSAIAAGQESEIVMTTCEAPDSYALLIAADSDITSIAELQGKTIGTVVGSTGHNLVKKLLETEGLDINEDVEIVNISTGDAATVLTTGEVDAVAIWEPNITRLTEDGTAQILATGSDCGLLGANQMTARTAYAQENPTVISIVIEQYARAVAEIDSLSGDTLTAVAEYLSIEEDQIQTIAEKFDYSVVVQDADIESLNDTISFLVTIDTLEEAYDISEYYNTSYLENADIDQYLE